MSQTEDNPITRCSQVIPNRATLFVVAQYVFIARVLVGDVFDVFAISHVKRAV